MMRTNWALARVSLAAYRNKPLPPAALERLLTGAVATWREFGALGAASLQQSLEITRREFDDDLLDETAQRRVTAQLRRASQAGRVEEDASDPQLTGRELRAAAVAWALELLAAGAVSPDDTAVVALDESRSPAAAAMVRATELAAGKIICTGEPAPARFMATTDSLPEPPTVLVCHADYLRLLDEHVDGLRPTLRQVIVEGLLTESERATIGPRLAVEPVELYSPSEVMPVRGRRCETGHLHFDRFLGHVELDSDAGRLLATTFAYFRQATPLVRHELPLRGRAIGSPPTCSLRKLPAVWPDVESGLAA